ncbi:MAG: DUF1015 family protein [Methanomicrobiales archaeon]|nr:DUF1015 family protein [Methanomicrobiales archaeon]
MVRIYPFRAVHPLRNAAQSIAAVPYDVVNASEAKACIDQNPFSFLRVSRADAELPDLPPHDERIYAKARENYLSLLRRGLIRRDESAGLYVYQVIAGSKEYTGLVACIDADEYLNNAVRRHELTVHEKERDRTLHIEALDAQEGLVFLVYRNKNRLAERIQKLSRQYAVPICEISTKTGALHRLYRIDNTAAIGEIVDLFKMVDTLYIADGHHRAAAAVNVALKRRSDGRGGAESGRFMGALLAHDNVTIHGYSRLLTDLSPMGEGEYLAKIRRDFSVTAIDRPSRELFEIPRDLESKKHRILLYLKSGWYLLEKPIEEKRNLIDTLDVVVLQQLVLEGILGIKDPRSDPRLHYLSGSRGHDQLRACVDSGRYAAAFAIQPVGIETVMAISDAGGIMPPKSTWFEPKLMSGMLVHPLD